jgi:hypothetical protein
MNRRIEQEQPEGTEMNSGKTSDFSDTACSIIVRRRNEANRGTEALKIAVPAPFV